MISTWAFRFLLKKKRKFRMKWSDAKLNSFFSSQSSTVNETENTKSSQFHVIMNQKLLYKKLFQALNPIRKCSYWIKRHFQNISTLYKVRHTHFLHTHNIKFVTIACNLSWHIHDSINFFIIYFTSNLQLIWNLCKK